MKVNKVERGKGPLEGVVVLDLTRVLSGPYCSMMLADLGAEVIKVERPGVGDDTRAWGPPFINGESAYFLSVNRNKKSIVLDLKDPEDQKKLRKLIEHADVIIENFRAGFMESIGFGYEQIKKINPRIIYGAISGFGRIGPYKDRPGYDLICQGMGGLQGITGTQNGEPVRIGVAIADIGAGMFLAYGILAALYHREKTGEGQYVETSLLEGQIAWLTYMAAYYFATGEVPKRMGSAHPTIVPYQAFRAEDMWINIAVGNDAQFRRFCKVIGYPELADDPKFATNAQRVINRDILVPMIQGILVTRKGEYWLRELEKAEIPCGAVYTLDKIFEDPQVKALGMKVDLEHPKAGRISVINSPIRFSKTPASIRAPPPLLGEHTEEIKKKYNLNDC